MCRNHTIKGADKQLEDIVYKDIKIRNNSFLDLLEKRVFTHASLLQRQNSNNFPMVSKKYW